MHDVIDDAHELIESRLAEIEAEAVQLERAPAHLGERPTLSRRPAGGEAAPSATPPSSNRRRKSSPPR